MTEQAPQGFIVMPADPAVIDRLSDLHVNLVPSGAAAAEISQLLQVAQGPAHDSPPAEPPADGPAERDADLALLDRTDATVRADLAAELLRRRHGISSRQAELDAEELESRKVAVEAQRMALEAGHTLVQQLQEWSKLARRVPWLLIGSLIGAFVLAILAYHLADNGRINGAEFGLVLFVLSVAAVSPSVLLLLERPLRGIDSFTPRGPAKGDAAKDQPKDQS